MEMHQVRYFVTLCETLNFTRAAEACHVAQPSLTKAIQKLEDELGGPLFSRERGLTHLTDLGRLMKPHLEAVYEASEAARITSYNVCYTKLLRARRRGHNDRGFVEYTRAAPTKWAPYNRTTVRSGTAPFLQSLAPVMSVITSYSIHYTKLYDPSRRRRRRLHYCWPRRGCR